MTKNELWDLQKKSLRNPREIWTCSDQSAGIQPNSLKYSANKKFIELLANLKLTLFISREYENLLISIYSDGDKIIQRYTAIAHPSGIACDRRNKLMYVASTRNPNVIYQFRPCEKNLIHRSREAILDEKPMVVSRKKFYPGLYYFHDLALISGELFGNTVGMNGVIKIDMNNPNPESILWCPKCTEDPSGNPMTGANYIQLNSIAAGDSIEESFFSASADKISKRRPGHLNYPVNRRGVIISGKTRNTIAGGLTRPHSARLSNGKIWVANSGYGEFGYIDDSSFQPIIKLNGWTRGVCLYKNVAFVATSRVIPQYRHYAPGLDGVKDQCGLHAISLSTGNIIGSINWSYGNQVFAIDYFPKKHTVGFLNKKTNDNIAKEIRIAYNH